jgi:Cd2+/Zn2+-exporting ATPase
VPLNGKGAADVLALAAAIETRSEHPIGRAIVHQAQSDGLTLLPASAVEAFPGRGAQGFIGAQQVLVGNRRMVEERGIVDPAIAPALASLAAAGRTGVIVALEGEPIGVIGVADEVRAVAKDVVAELTDHGVEHIVLLTGDQTVTARALAASVGITDYRAELLPEDKLAAVGELRARFGTLAMVGDGVNDAPALAAADVGIAMGVAGTDAALETADVALMADDLAKIPFAIRLSRAAARNIRLNIGFSLGLKAAFLVLAIAGVATLWMAVVADTGASLIVIANALRLLRE